MSDLLLQLVDEVRKAAPTATERDSLRDDFLPAIERATSVDDVERAMHAAAASISALQTEVTRDLLGDFFVRASTRLLVEQDAVTAAYRAASDVAAEEVLLAHETLRRLLVEMHEHFDASIASAPADTLFLQTIVKPTADYVTGAVVRLILLLVAGDRLLELQRADVAGDVTRKAFETSQTLRGAAAEMAIDLTPWLDVPDIRIRRLLHSGSAFWNAMTPEQQATVEAAWAERMDISPRWP